MCRFLLLRTPPVRLLRWAVALGLSALCLGQNGCVQRRMLIRSNPPGATVYVDDYEIGTTPVAAGFIYYGTRKIRLVKDGYETLTVMQPMSPPWYEIPPLDLVSENFVPGELRDFRCLSFNLRPQQVVPSGQLLDRAEQLRRSMPAGGPPTPSPVGAVPAQPLPSGGALLPSTAPATPPPTTTAPATTGPVFSTPGAALSTPSTPSDASGYPVRQMPSEWPGR
jgi:hypothetical protein